MIAPFILRRQEAADLVRELAFRGKSLPVIRKRLLKENLEGLLDQGTIKSLRNEASMARRVTSRPGTKLARAVGIVAILSGAFVLSISQHGVVAGRYNPRGFGGAALIAGIVLVIRPSWGREKI